MTSIDRLVDIELLLERGLLRSNYDNLTTETGQECKDLVVEYAGLTESVAHKDINFIKDLTKVAQHIIDLDSTSLDGLLVRFHQFNIDGVQKVRMGIQGHPQDHLSLLESHFLGHASDVSVTIFDKTGSISWGERSYEERKLSAETSDIVDPDYSYRAHSFAGNIAEAIFNKTGDVSWAEKWYNSKMSSAQKSAGFDIRYSFHAYSFVADAAKGAYDILNKSQHVSIEEEIVWLERWYDSRMSSAQMSVEIDPRHSAHSYGFAGDAANILFEKTRDTKWAQKAVESYTSFLDYFYVHPDMGITRIMENIEYNVFKLKGFLPEI